MNTSSRLLIAAQLLIAIAYAVPILTSDRLRGSDFVCFYTGGSIVRDGRGADLYDVDLQRVYQRRVNSQGEDNSRGGFLPFINPPHAALLFMPFAYIPPKSAVIVHLTLNCIVVAWILWRLWQLTFDWNIAARVLAVTTFLSTEVFWYGLGIGALTLFMLACLMEYYIALRAGRDGRAAIWLMAATLKPQLMLLPALVPFMQRRWRLIGMAASLGLLFGIVVSVSLGFHVWIEYLRLLRVISAAGETYGALPWLMDNVRMVLYWTVPSSLVGAGVYLALAAGMGGVLWLWHSVQHFRLKFAVTVLLGLLVAPYLHYQDTLLAMLPAAIAYDCVRNHRMKLVSVFRVVMLATTFLPALIIFLRTFTSSGSIVGWIWPFPLILTLLIVSVNALRQKEA